MWNGKKKAITFSYDDGVEFDARLVEIFNRYGLKCTFNLNSGIMSRASFWESEGVTIHRMNAANLKELYKGHEIAVHCLTHANLVECDDETVRNELLLDKENLERLFDCEIYGMAYPYGAMNERVLALVEECGFHYGRGVWSTGEIVSPDPEHMIDFRPTFHHSEERMLDKIEEFLALDPEKMEEPKMLYIWGHSYEFELRNNWDFMEKLCKLVSGRDDIFYGTNWEVLKNFAK